MIPEHLAWAAVAAFSALFLVVGALVRGISVNRERRRAYLLGLLDTSGPGGTCDWGNCSRAAVSVRYSQDHGWLPVCARHDGEDEPGATWPPRRGHGAGTLLSDGDRVPVLRGGDRPAMPDRAGGHRHAIGAEPGAAGAEFWRSPHGTDPRGAQDPTGDLRGQVADDSETEVMTWLAEIGRDEHPIPAGYDPDWFRAGMLFVADWRREAWELEHQGDEIVAAWMAGAMRRGEGRMIEAPR